MKSVIFDVMKKNVCLLHLLIKLEYVTVKTEEF